MPERLDPPQQRVEIRRFLIQVTVVLTIFTALAFTGMYLRTQQLMADGALTQARSYADLVVTMRAWNSRYGGVWVDRKLAGGTNAYLAKLGVSADATTTTGEALTLRNPAIMTREVSELLTDRSDVSFRLTSLKPVNPDNAPDSWERASLVAFEQGSKERWITERGAVRLALRYMRPLMVEPTCLRCHGGQGYTIGDVRGAISVTVPLAAEDIALRVNAGWLSGLGILTTLVLLGLTYMMIRQLTNRLISAESELVRMATHDSLTGLANRRQVLERLDVEASRSLRTGEPLSVIMMDVDHFKDVNDSRGHAAGDSVLVEIARRISATSRPYDLVGRFGGEEFLLVAPSTELDDAVGLAQRVRAAVADAPIDHAGGAIRVTLSAGVSAVDPAEPDALDRALARSDHALYRSKDAGRDSVTAAPPTPGEDAAR
jgi:diguanylate cyclase (GGDEF)-like protein